METEQNEIQTTNFQDPSELQKYKMKYDALLIESDEEFNNPKSEDFYVLSKTFLREWNEYVGYESGHPDLKKKPTYFNSDLIESLEETKKYVKMSTQIILKKGFQNKIDYEVINKNLMDFFEKDFAGIRIQRKAYTQQDGHKFVEVYLKDLNAVFISHSCLVEIDRNQRHELLVQKLQVSSQSTIQEFKEVLLKINGKNNFGLENLRLWKISQEIDKFFKETKQTCNNTKSFDYEIPIKGIFLEKNLEVKIEDFGFTEADILIIEIRENTENWNFVQNDVPTMKKCGFCSKYAETVLICGCKKVCFFIF